MADEIKYDPNKFDLKYFLAPKKQDAFKALKYGLIFCLILGFGYLIYRGAEALFPKPKSQIIKVSKGGTATIIQEADKRWFIMFVEPFVGIRTDTEGEGRAEVGGRLGCRIEF